jgi:hypothetical protein
MLEEPAASSLRNMNCMVTEHILIIVFYVADISFGFQPSHLVGHRNYDNGTKKDGCQLTVGQVFGHSVDFFDNMC